MSVTLRIYIAVVIIFLAGISSVCRYKQLDVGGKTITAILILQLVNEIVAFLFAKKFHNNMPVYNVNDILELALIAFYFNSIIRLFRRSNIAIWIGIIAVAFGVINFTFIQDFMAFSVNYLLFEGFCIILMALIAFYYFLMNQDDLRLYRYPHFWFISILLFFWSVTYVTWGIFPLVHSKRNIELVGFFIWLVNIISYTAIALVFLFYPKMKTINE